MSWTGEKGQEGSVGEELWVKYRREFLRAVGEGGRNVRVEPARHRSVYDYPNRKEPRGPDGYLIK